MTADVTNQVLTNSKKNVTIDISCPVHIKLDGASDKDSFGYVYNGVFDKKPNKFIKNGWHRQAKNRRGQLIRLFISNAFTRVGRLRVKQR